VLVENAGKPNENLVWEYGGLASLNHGADAHRPSNLNFPSKGQWKLDLYLGKELFGSINIEVK
jgi:hypothetical protein